MAKPNNTLLAGIVAVVVVSIFVGYRVISATFRPLGESQYLEFPSEEKSKSEIESLLSGDFTTIKHVEAFPEPIRRLYREKGGSRYTIANPGKNYSVSDAIIDPSLPMQRLIVAGLSSDRFFIHYEQCGEARSSVIDVLRIESTGNVQPLGEAPARTMTSQH